MHQNSNYYFEVIDFLSVFSEFIRLILDGLKFFKHATYQNYSTAIQYPIIKTSSISLSVSQSLILMYLYKLRKYYMKGRHLVNLLGFQLERMYPMLDCLCLIPSPDSRLQLHAKANPWSDGSSSWSPVTHAGYLA